MFLICGGVVCAESWSRLHSAEAEPAAASICLLVITIFSLYQEPPERRPQPGRPRSDTHLPGSLKAQSVSPAPTTMYCRPSSRNVDGPLLTMEFRRRCQAGLPLAGS